ncbi:MAG TPA: prepilin-type N-terminal cleavage/methylation domain-containing protein [Pyrinomonadaceae bacterium]|nr:prepilin-type N-terminal cleavage/methylation domain-containing protein [Pyrinomonadaceae bacterium]
MKTNFKKQTRRKQAAQGSKGERGFTLVETSISMVVMMVAGLAISSLFVFSLQNNVGGADRALAMAVAQQQLEQLRSVSFEDTTLAVGTTTSTVNSGGRGYSVAKTIADETNDDLSSKQLKRITITVTPLNGALNWTRSSVVLVSFRSTLASGSYAVQ